MLLKEYLIDNCENEQLATKLSIIVASCSFSQLSIRCC